MAFQVYFTATDGTGDWYQSRTATTPGQSPETHPAKWHKEEIPFAFRDVIVARSLSILLAGEGQDDKSFAKERLADTKLDALRMQMATRSDRRNRPSVMTR